MSLDIANSVADVIYRLGFADHTALAASNWISDAQLYQFADDAMRKLAAEKVLFVSWNGEAGTPITLANATAQYTLQSGHVFTIMATAITSGGVASNLRITQVKELWALDGLWPTTAGPPKRVSLDAGPVGTITIYPVAAVADGTLNQIMQGQPSTVQSGTSTVQLPTVLQDYFTYAALAGARGKESDNSMGEMAEFFKGMMGLYEQVMSHLWGPAVE